MEALTAAAVAALTVYDMTKALDKAIVIRDIRLESKSGGKSGDFLKKRFAWIRPVSRNNAREGKDAGCPICFGNALFAFRVGKHVGAHGAQRHDRIS
jgi:hypothetical protein